MCGYTRDPIIYSEFHRNPFRGFGAPGGQNLAFPITLASRFYNSLYYRTSRPSFSGPPFSLAPYNSQSRPIDGLQIVLLYASTIIQIVLAGYCIWNNAWVLLCPAIFVNRPVH